MPSHEYLVLDLAAISLFAYVVRIYLADRSRRGGLRYPPGPRGLPLLGNLFDIPQRAPWETYAQWGKQYGNAGGDVTSISVLGRLVVFVNTARAAKDLFEHTGTRYMDRPAIPIIDMYALRPFCKGVLLIPGCKDGGAFQSCHHTVWAQVAGRAADHRPEPASRDRSDVSADANRQGTCVPKEGAAVSGKDDGVPETVRPDHIIVTRLLDDDSGCSSFTGAVVMSLTYGYDVKESGDHYVAIAEELLTLASESILPGALLVNDFPALKHVPDWFPGAGFKKRARHGKKLSYEMVNAPFEMVKEDLLKGTSKHSLVHDNLDECRGDEAEETALKNAAASVYAAGAETTISTLSSFLLALLLYPEVQRRAQAEIDQAIGRSRLPAFSDRPNLPYVDAVCKELLRWRLVLPLSVAHATTEDDVYKGYFIPKGTTVLPNTWAILHDAEVYPEPEEFKPERFLTEGGKVKDDSGLMYAFGYGRRMCPGRHLVDSTLWILVVNVLAAFNVRKKMDLHGNEIPVAGEYKGALIAHPVAFEYAITPRHPGAARLVQETSTCNLDSE